MPLRTKVKAAEVVGEVLQNYANRGVFRGFSRAAATGSTAVYKLLWHRNQSLDLILDVSRKTLRMPVMFPNVSPEMAADFRKFAESRFTSVSEHRRIDFRKMRVRCSRRKGNLSITATVTGGDFAYATRKLVHLVHEAYLVFLNDGKYYDYLIETFDLDPDHM